VTHVPVSETFEFHVGASLPGRLFRRTINSPLVLLVISERGFELCVRRPVPRTGFPPTRFDLDDVRRIVPIRGRFSTYGFLLEGASGAETQVWCLSNFAAAEVLGVISRLGVPIDPDEVFIGWWKRTFG
jgi:hypothetical protein